MRRCLLRTLEPHGIGIRIDIDPHQVSRQYAPIEDAHRQRILDQALEDHSFAPRDVRWRNWRWARAARRLLAQAERDEKMKEDTEAK